MNPNVTWCDTIMQHACTLLAMNTAVHIRQLEGVCVCVCVCLWKFMYEVRGVSHLDEMRNSYKVLTEKH
jgi:hypothetical protein